MKYESHDYRGRVINVRGEFDKPTIQRIHIIGDEARLWIDDRKGKLFQIQLGERELAEMIEVSQYALSELRTSMAKETLPAAAAALRILGDQNREKG